MKFPSLNVGLTFTDNCFEIKFDDSSLIIGNVDKDLIVNFLNETIGKYNIYLNESPFLILRFLKLIYL